MLEYWLNVELIEVMLDGLVRFEFEDVCVDVLNLILL